MLSFRNASLKIGRPTPEPVYNIYDPQWFMVTDKIKTWA